MVELFLSAYEDAWANCHRDYLERIDGAVEVLATATNGATLAIEHTLIEPFVGDTEDFVRFRDSFLRIEDDTSLIVPERAVYVDVPVQSLKKHERAPAVRALHEWLTANVRSLPVDQSQHDCPIRLDENNYGVLSLEIRVESIPQFKGALLIRRYGEEDALAIGEGNDAGAASRENWESFRNGAEIERANAALQKVGGKRRGRPPKWATDAPAHERTQRKKDQPPN